MVGSRARAPAARGRLRQPAHCARRAELDLLDQRAVRDVPRRRAARLRLHRRGEGRRHPGEQHAAAPTSCTRTWSIEANLIRGAHAAGVRAADVPRLELHLSARLPAADQGGVPADRPARADQRAVRDRQDRRHQAVRGATTRQYGRQLRERDADQPVRPERQLRPGDEPRAAGADPQGARGEAARRRRDRRLGQRHAAARVPVRRRPGRCLRLPDGARRRRAGAGQHRHRRRT